MNTHVDGHEEPKVGLYLNDFSPSGFFVHLPVSPLTTFDDIRRILSEYIPQKVYLMTARHNFIHTSEYQTLVLQHFRDSHEDRKIVVILPNPLNQSSLSSPLSNQPKLSIMSNNPQNDALLKEISSAFNVPLEGLTQFVDKILYQRQILEDQLCPLCQHGKVGHQCPLTLSTEDPLEELGGTGDLCIPDELFLPYPPVSERARLHQIISGQAVGLSPEQQLAFLTSYLDHDHPMFPQVMAHLKDRLT